MPKEKPISLLMIENFVNEICTCVKNGYSVPAKYLKKAPKMVKALNDTADKLPDLSLQFYNLVR